MGVRMSSKTITYLLGLQVMLGSTSNSIVSLSCLLSGFLIKKNFCWLQNIIYVPKMAAKMTQTLLGWLIDSSAPQQVAMGATLEIQRTQQVEALEQHFIQQQARSSARRMAGGVNVRRFNNPFNNQQRPVQEVAPEPTEAHISLLVDMGFPRQQAFDALREAHNDLSTATAILLRNT